MIITKNNKKDWWFFIFIFRSSPKSEPVKIFSTGTQNYFMCRTNSYKIFD